MSVARGVDGAPSPTLEASYARCRELSRRHGTTYHLATYALPRIKRHHVWALYALCRHADDIVDDIGPCEDRSDRQTDDRSGDGTDVAARAAALAAFAERFRADLAAGHSEDPILRAVVHTVRAFGQPVSAFDRFFHAMEMDLSVASYDTWDDLVGYMDGSAAVIGELMLPILEPAAPAAVHPARDLGFAFQLTNFLRDVGEDLDRGRVYLPREDIERFGADPTRRVVDDAWKQLMRFEIDRCRELYRSADAGIDLLPPSSARCVWAARVLYSEIIDEIEAADYDVFSGRVRVPRRRKMAVAAMAALRRGN